MAKRRVAACEERTRSSSVLDGLLKVAQILALVGIPLAVAWLGWNTQASLAEAATRKDFVQMAVQVLHEPRRKDDEAIRQWAKEVIAKNSPVPFSTDAADQLSGSALAMLRTSPLLKPVMEARPDCPSISGESVPEAIKKDISTLQHVCHRNAKDLFWVQIYLRLLSEDHQNERN